MARVTEHLPKDKRSDFDGHHRIICLGASDIKLGGDRNSKYLWCSCWVRFDADHKDVRKAVEALFAAFDKHAANG